MKREKLWKDQWQQKFQGEIGGGDLIKVKHKHNSWKWKKGTTNSLHH